MTAHAIVYYGTLRAAREAAQRLAARQARDARRARIASGTATAWDLARARFEAECPEPGRESDSFTGDNAISA